MNTVENIEMQGEIAYYEQYIYMFQKSSAANIRQNTSACKWERDNELNDIKYTTGLITQRGSQKKIKGKRDSKPRWDQ